MIRRQKNFEPGIAQELGRRLAEGEIVLDQKNARGKGKRTPTSSSTLLHRSGS